MTYRCPKCGAETSIQRQAECLIGEDGKPFMIVGKVIAFTVCCGESVNVIDPPEFYGQGYEGTVVCSTNSACSAG